MEVGIALLGVAVLLGAWDLGEAPVSTGVSVQTAPLVGTAGDNSGLSWWKTKWYRTGATLVATALFYTTLVMVLKAVLSLGLSLYGKEEEDLVASMFQG